MVDKVIATPAALALIEQLRAEHGSFFFHQSGGCCDNSAANAYLPGELTIGAGDVYLGDIGGCRFYIGKGFGLIFWNCCQGFTVRGLDGDGSGFVGEFVGRHGFE